MSNTVLILTVTAAILLVVVGCAAWEAYRDNRAWSSERALNEQRRQCRALTEQVQVARRSRDGWLETAAAHEQAVHALRANVLFALYCVVSDLLSYGDREWSEGGGLHDTLPSNEVVVAWNDTLHSLAGAVAHEPFGGDVEALMGALSAATWLSHIETERAMALHLAYAIALDLRNPLCDAHEQAWALGSGESEHLPENVPENAPESPVEARTDAA